MVGSYWYVRGDDSDGLDDVGFYSSSPNWTLYPLHLIP